MSIGAVGGVSAQPDWAGAAPVSQEAQQSQAASKSEGEQKNEQITTVTTHCNKKHWHGPECPHTTVTRPAPKQGQPGYLLDEKA